ncbi:Ig-like domain-containing protein, partial [Gardnerella vaginalis]|uniref:Ig-like domain-containing protein n=1 Tax=Gardnerella vaginalis TaxID=2702 RepID=UPI0039F05FBA
APTVTVPANGNGQGSATITPAADTDTLEITYTPEGDNTNPTKFTVKKDTDGKWKKGQDTPAGVSVDETSGAVTIPADKIKDNSEVKAKDKKGDTSSDSATGNVGKNPAKPTVSDPKAENKTGNKTTVSGKATPGATVTISKDGKEVGKVTAGTDGTFTVDIDKQDPNTTLTLTPSKDGATGTPVTATVTGSETPAAKPT